MTKFNLNDYEMVEDRLKAFWKDNPNGRIFTEVVHITDDGTCVTIRTLGYKDIDDVNPVATGIAQETKGQGGFANADAWMENCETSSIGRMLANWKYQGSNKKRPSLEEMSKTQGETKVAQAKTKPTPTQDNAVGVTSPAALSKAMGARAVLKDAGFDWQVNAMHEKGEPAMNDTDLLCICGLPVQYISPAEKKSQKSPDFRCTGASKCSAGDTVDGKVFSKSWWTDGWNTPEAWKDYAAAMNGIKVPTAKSMDDIDKDAAPF